LTEKKIIVIGAKITSIEYSEVVKIANEQNINISELVRQSVFSAEIKNNKTEKEILYELNRITNFLDGVSNNFNQIAKYINTQKYLDREVLKVLLLIEEEMENFREVKRNAL